MSSVGAAIEALLLMATEPVDAATLASAIGVPQNEVESELTNLARFYEETARGFQLREIAGGWRYYTHPDQAELIGAWVTSEAYTKLSQAALETLAVIAYRQPISRGRVSAVRGVNVDGVVRTLTSRGLVTTSGHDGETGAELLVTTPYLLERLGMNGLDELPPLAPHLPDAVALEAELAELAMEGGDD